MTTTEQIITRLETPEIYNFRDILDSYIESPAQTGINDQVLNTLELFAYGGCSAYSKSPGKYMNLSEKGKEKLIQLSILSVLNGNVGNYVSFNDIIRVVNPFITEPLALESVLITMTDSDTIKVKIDEKKQVLRVVDTPVLRDAYNESTYRLRVLEIEDLMVLLVGRAKQILQKWLDESIAPVQQEFVVG